MRRAVLLFAIVGVTVRADVTRHRNCDSCLVDVASARTEPAPLLVVLHGNNESGEERAVKWRDATTRRGWELLALDCPRDLGCDEVGRWYMWNGDTKWIRDQVRRHAEKTKIDMSRVYLAGWSGGATYIGKHMHEWSTMFAGVVIHGGGVPPRTDRCPERAVPVYFLVGDKNPAHGGARRLREYVLDCDLPMKWDLLPGANHAKEDDALTPGKVDAILGWLETRGRGIDVFASR